MTTTWQGPGAPAHGEVLRSFDDVEAYVETVCFKTGPAQLVGVELEWTVHHRADPTRPLDQNVLTAALGPHAPTVLDPESPHQVLPQGNKLTVEPGGQVEISTMPYASLAELRTSTELDHEYLGARLARSGLELGELGIDPHRTPHRMLRTPRYDAMATSYTGPGLPWQTMMCSAAGLQVCLDSGEPGRVTTRWQTLQDLGPLLLATFANSAVETGPYRGSASARMAAWLGMDPMRSAPLTGMEDPAGAWARYAVGAPVLCVRDMSSDSWRAPPGVSFADWLAGAIPRRPTVEDLELHLSTLFPPVRPRGYFEVRYLDTQRGDQWFLPAAMLTALFARESTVDRVRELCDPVTDEWQTAAQDGLTDQTLHRVATEMVDLACRELCHTDLNGPQRDEVAEGLHLRLARLSGSEP